VNRRGAVCQNGDGCADSRDLYDDFGVAASPTSGRASIVYSDDQYRSDGLNVPAPACTPSATNTSKCDHTMVTTQISGPGIYR
jgi:hypothetical protein